MIAWIATASRVVKVVGCDSARKLEELLRSFRHGFIGIGLLTCELLESEIVDALNLAVVDTGSARIEGRDRSRIRKDVATSVDRKVCWMNPTRV